MKRKKYQPYSLDHFEKKFKAHVLDWQLPDEKVGLTKGYVDFERKGVEYEIGYWDFRFIIEYEGNQTNDQLIETFAEKRNG